MMLWTGRGASDPAHDFSPLGVHSDTPPFQQSIPVICARGVERLPPASDPLPPTCPSHGRPIAEPAALLAAAGFSLPVPALATAPPPALRAGRRARKNLGQNSDQGFSAVQALSNGCVVQRPSLPSDAIFLDAMLVRKIFGRGWVRPGQPI